MSAPPETLSHPLAQRKKDIFYAMSRSTVVNSENTRRARYAPEQTL